MNIGFFLFALISALVGFASTAYLVVSMLWILGEKIVRKIKYGTSLYD